MTRSSTTMMLLALTLAGVSSLAAAAPLSGDATANEAAFGAFGPVTPAGSPAPQAIVIERPEQTWSTRWGIGARGGGALNVDDRSAYTVGGELLYRMSRHLALEVAGEYQHDLAGSIDRRDVPVTVGVRLHLGQPDWTVSPYFVVASGVDFAHEDLHPVVDDAYFLDGQVGGGLEIRLGDHAAITADVRADGRLRLNAAPTVLASGQGDGKPLQQGWGAQAHLGVAVYF